jgi:hypothetical protein
MSVTGAANIERIGGELEGLIALLIDRHTGLLGAVKGHRAALSAANVEAMEESVRKQNEHVQAIADLERRRLAVLARLAEATGQDRARGSEKPTLAWAAGLLPEPIRGRVLAAGAALKERLTELSVQTKVVRQAAEAVAGQMEGLFRQVAQRLSHSGTYNPRGRVEARTQVVTSLDIRS